MSDIKKLIPDLHREDYLKVSLYSWVKAQTSALPSLSVTKAVENFLKANDISEDEYPLQAARSDFYRTQKKDIDNQKTK